MSFSFFVTIIALLFSFFVIGAVLGAAFSKPLRKKIVATLRLERFLLDKSNYNPILKPGRHPWTMEAVLNPAAAIIDGRTHLVYRAIGMDGVSRLGYASSPDGFFFDKQLPYPAYVARSPEKVAEHLRRYSPVMYPSGGSWGGCEDPRMVVIDDQVYVTFNMFEQWRLRVAVISLSVEDFLANRFHMWTGPTILSHGERDKNWVLFPEKINGQFAILHSIIGDDSQHVRIEYVDELEKLAHRKFVSPDPQGVPNKNIAWHVHTRSAGPPPLKTDRGWLVFYHANDAHEGHRYKLGAMLLDLADPTRILHRAEAPVLSPDAQYENDGKPGIVYACGAVIQDGKIRVYYGGGDKVACVATTPLKEFVDALVAGRQPSLAQSMPAQTI